MFIGVPMFIAFGITVLDAPPGRTDPLSGVVTLSDPPSGDAGGLRPSCPAVQNLSHK
jgi:hypothetical protein